MDNHSERDANGKESHDFNAKFVNRDKVKVGGQFNVMYGDVHIYDVGPSASPEERFAAALNFLDGNVPSRAEKLISEAVDGDYRSNKVAYYWALSVLSGRSFDHLQQEDFDTVQGCLTLLDQETEDEWLSALKVILQFVNCLIQQDRGSLDDEEFEFVIEDYDHLQKDRREEIRRHLDLIMTGALQDRLDTKYAAEIEQARKAGNRERRAWKFFAPVPEPPRLETFTEPQLGKGQRVTAVLGAIVGGTALLMTFVAALLNAPLLGLVLLVGTGGGGYLLVTTGRSWLAAREEAAASDARSGGYPQAADSEPWRGRPGRATGYARHGAPSARGRYQLDSPQAENAESDSYEWGLSDKADKEHAGEVSRRKLFESYVKPWIDLCFADENPDGSKHRDRWWKDTEGLRRALAADLTRRYAGPDIAVNQLDWLMTWYARRARERWNNDSLRADRTGARDVAPSGVLAFLGIVGAVAGLACGLAGVFDGNLRYGGILLLVMGVSGWIVYGSEFDSYVVRRDLHQAESASAAERYDKEKAEFDRWEKVLEDRPTDAEMGRWLDYDKLFVKNQVMKQRSFANRDLVTHAILTEGQYLSHRARVVFGPPRYSNYQMTVILLTERGVRKVSMGLNFLDGTVSRGEGRQVFPYDSISAADIVKVEVRFEGDRRKVITVDEEAGDDAKQPKDDARQPNDKADKKGREPVSVILGEALRVSLNSGGYADFVVSNFDEALLDRRREKAEDVHQLTMETSGMTRALQVLEAVSAEGSGWIIEERRRRERRILDLQSATAAGPRELADRTNGRPRRELGAVSSRDDVIQLAVSGGNLVVERARAASVPILAVHGISSQRRQWNWLRAARTDLSLIMPDLRGRGDSAGVSGPSSIARHAADMVAVLDQLGLDAVHVCGMSMGGFVAVEMAGVYPERVKSLILVDGGFPSALPYGLTPEATPAVVRARLVNRDVVWPSVREYAQYFTGEVAQLLDPSDPLLLDYLMHDLDGHRLRLDCDMLAADTASMLFAPPATPQIRVPVRLIRAEWSTGAGSAPAYPDETVRGICQELGAPATVTSMAGFDHTACIMSRAGAGIVAGQIDEALS